MSRQESENQLARFRELSISGKYQKSIHQFLMRETDPALGDDDPLVLEIKLHYAVALQHAGLFLNASEYFQLILDECTLLTKAPGDRYDGIRQTAMLHLAVLLERLKQPSRALKILNEVGTIQGTAVTLAWASPKSFFDITLMKSHLQLGELEPVKDIIARASQGDQNQQLWSSLFAGIVSIKEGKRSKRIRAKKQIRDVLETIEREDPHGAPWFSLTAGQYLIDEDQQFAKEQLLRAEKWATHERKLFVVAEASHHLCKVNRLQGNQADAERFLRRAVGGYQRCGVLLRPPLQEEVYKEVIDVFGEERGQRIFTLTAGIIDPHSLHFGQMCKAHAIVRTKKSRAENPQADETDPWMIFEEFVRDWASVVFPGRAIMTNPNQEAVDVRIDQSDGCIFVQSKILSKPRDARPKKDFPSKRLTEKYGKFRKFVFVVASLKEGGWQPNDWDASLDEKVWELLPDSWTREMFDQAVTEPVLQIDTALEPSLFDKYFRYHLTE